MKRRELLRMALAAPIAAIAARLGWAPKLSGRHVSVELKTEEGWDEIAWPSSGPLTPVVGAAEWGWVDFSGGALPRGAAIVGHDAEIEVMADGHLVMHMLA